MLPLPGGAGLSPIANGASRLVEFSDPDVAFTRIEPERLIWALLDVLSGLRALHEAELDGGPFVHGSITPQYILLGEPGSARLVPVTSAHLMPNVPRKPTGYVAPELLRGEPADQRADVFSIGVLLWEALAGRRLFPDAARSAVLGRLERGDTPRLADLVKASWALPLCRVAERAIAAKAAERFGSALELSSAIVLAAGCHLTSAPAEVRPRPSRWRNMTPPATVIDLPPAPGSTLGELDSVTRLAPPAPPAPPIAASGLDWSDEEVVSQPVRRARIPRKTAWLLAGVLGVACLVLAAAGRAPAARPPMASSLDTTEPKATAPIAIATPAVTASSSVAPAASIAPPTEPKPPAQKPASLKVRSVSRSAHRPDSDYGI
jgi:eukaryotic-like serine/threonine-protein kinase